MSVVSSVILQVSCCEDGFDCDDGANPFHLDSINAWLSSRGFAGLADLTEYMSGNKHPQTFVFGAGYDHFPEDDFAYFVVSLAFRVPECAVLLINPEDGAARIFRPKG